MSGGGEGGGDLDVNLNLTALLDVISNLLFFLMFSFAAQQSAIELEGELNLPVSSAELPPKKALNVFIGKSELRVEKEVVATIKGGKIVGAAEGRIEPFYKRLVAMRQQRVAGKEAGEDDDVLLVSCDKEAPYALLKQILLTGAEAGFPKFRMAVLME